MNEILEDLLFDAADGKDEAAAILLRGMLGQAVEEVPVSALIDMGRALVEYGKRQKAGATA